MASRLIGEGPYHRIRHTADGRHSGCHLHPGDFTEDEVFEQILAAIGGQPVDLVISDMAPNMSGTPAVDQPRAMYLCELALDMAARVLRPGGDFLIKVFHGEGFDDYYRDMRGRFDKVLTRKPGASRDRSRETYLLGRGFKGE